MARSDLRGGVHDRRRELHHAGGERGGEEEELRCPRLREVPRTRQVRSEQQRARFATAPPNSESFGHFGRTVAECTERNRRKFGALQLCEKCLWY